MNHNTGRRFRTDKVSPLVWVLTALAALIYVTSIGNTILSGHSLNGPAKTVQRTSNAEITGLFKMTMDFKVMFVGEDTNTLIDDPHLGTPLSTTAHQATPERWTKLLAAAERGFDTTRSKNSARRLMIVRGIAHVPILANTKMGTELRLGFAGIDANTVDSRDEWAMWNTIAKSETLNEKQYVIDRKMIERHTSLGWWTIPELVVLDRSEPHRVNLPVDESRLYHSSVRDFVLVGLASVALVLLGLYGLGVLIYLVIRYLQTWSTSGLTVPPAHSLWKGEPGHVANPDRKLKANDLLSIFLVYLILPHVLSTILFGWELGHFRINGVFHHWQNSTQRESASHRAGVSIVLESIFYCVTGFIPIIWLFILAKKRGASLSSELGLTLGRPLKNVGYALSGYAMMFPIISVISVIASRTLEKVAAPSNPVIPMLASAPSVGFVILMVIVATIMAPLVEETMFRGVLYQGLRQKLGIWPSIVISGIVFGCGHPVGPAEMIVLSTIGISFAWITESRKSLFPNMLCHFIQNSLATGSLLLFYKY